MVKCSNCGVEVADTFDSCPNCGNELNSSADANSKGSLIKCSNCGCEVEEGQLVCPDCGNKIAELKITKKCPYCGVELDQDAQFCDSCGKSLNASSILSNSVDSEDHAPIANGFNESFLEIFSGMNWARLGKYAICCLIFSIILTLIFMFILQLTTSRHSIPDYTAAYILALIIGVLIFASFHKSIVEGGVLGLIVGLLLGILESPIATLYFGNSIGYDVFFGSNTSTFILVGILCGIIANLFLKSRISNAIDLDKYLG